MYLPECLVWALEYEDVSTVKIFCDDNIKKEVADYFTEQLSLEWKRAQDKANAEFNGIEDENSAAPIKVDLSDYGVRVNVITVEIRYAGGDFYDLEYGSDALSYALKATKAKYPEIEYDGYIALACSDRRSGDVSQWAITTTGEKKAYDFIGEALGRILANEEHIWMRSDDREIENLTFVVTGKLKYFENREDINEYIEDLGATVSGSVSKKTSYLINNDIRSESSKNIKAIELNIPIITEAEFIARFGDPDEYDIDFDNTSDFWRILSENLLEMEADTSEYIDIMETLYDHREWINKDDLRRAVFSLIDMAMETDSECRDELIECLKKFENGEKIERDDNKDELSAGLPNGYMEALSAAMAADEYEKELAHDGVLPDAPLHGKNQVVSLSIESYPRISLKAKEGDKKAMEIIEMIKNANS